MNFLATVKKSDVQLIKTVPEHQISELGHRADLKSLVRVIVSSLAFNIPNPSQSVGFSSISRVITSCCLYTRPRGWQKKSNIKTHLACPSPENRSKVEVFQIYVTTTKTPDRRSKLYQQNIHHFKMDSVFSFSRPLKNIYDSHNTKQVFVVRFFF